LGGGTQRKWYRMRVAAVIEKKVEKIGGKRIEKEDYLDERELERLNVKLNWR
jgi:hypothetical protein